MNAMVSNEPRHEKTGLNVQLISTFVFATYIVQYEPQTSGIFWGFGHTQSEDDTSLSILLVSLWM